MRCGLVTWACTPNDTAGLGAGAVELKPVTHELKAKAGRDLFLKLLDLFVFELEHKVALDADQVIVVRGVATGLVHRLTLAKASMVGEAALGEQLERAVHGRVADPRVLLARLRQDLLDAAVARDRKEGAGDDIALTRRLETLAHQIALELLHQAIDVAGLRRSIRHGHSRLSPAALHGKRTGLAIHRTVGFCGHDPILRASMAGRTSRSKHADASVARDSGTDSATDEQGGALKIDEILDSLEGIVEELEGGELPLETALARFERGITLARKGTEMLDALEMRVEQLLADPDAPGGQRTAPFATTDDDDVALAAGASRRGAPAGVQGSTRGRAGARTASARSKLVEDDSDDSDDDDNDDDDNEDDDGDNL